jgi:hypothetical protein
VRVRGLRGAALRDGGLRRIVIRDAHARSAG